MARFSGYYTACDWDRSTRAVYNVVVGVFSPSASSLVNAPGGYLAARQMRCEAVENSRAPSTRVGVRAYRARVHMQSQRRFLQCLVAPQHWRRHELLDQLWESGARGLRFEDVALRSDGRVLSGNQLQVPRCFAAFVARWRRRALWSPLEQRPPSAAFNNRRRRRPSRACAQPSYVGRGGVAHQAA